MTYLSKYSNYPIQAHHYLCNQYYKNKSCSNGIFSLVKHISHFFLKPLKYAEHYQNASIFSNIQSYLTLFTISHGLLQIYNDQHFSLLDLKRAKCRPSATKHNIFFITIEITSFFFLLYINIQNNSHQINYKMGNTQLHSRQQNKGDKIDEQTYIAAQADIEQKNIGSEYEQDQNPLAKTLQKGILKKSIIASNNKLIDSHNSLSSFQTPKLAKKHSKPRVSLELKLLSRQNMEKLKKFSSKVIEEGSVANQLSLSTQKQKQNPKSFKQNSNFSPILINKESLMNIQQTNIHKKYKMLQKIGQGGFASVYKAVCLLTHQQRAIKVVPIKHHSSFHKKLVQNQVSMLLKLDHPTIIKVYEIIKSQNNYYIVTEYCDGGTLCDYLNKNKQEKGQKFAKNVMKKLLSAIKYLHSKKIIHRDIKLDNIVVKKIKKEADSQELIIKIIDFGLSIQTSSNVIKSDKLIGTLQYIAPQSIIGMYSLKSDIWSCGVIFYMLLSGHSPFRGTTKSKTFTKIKNQEPDLRNYEWRSISPQAKELLFKMLSKCTINRPSAQEALRHPFFREDDLYQGLPNSHQIANRFANFKSRNNLIAFIETYTCLTKLSQPQRQRLIKHFNHIDKNQNGQIELLQIKTYLARNKKDMSNEDTSNIIKRLDLNYNQKIDLNEFLCALTNLQKYFERQYITQIFNLFDQNHDGYINKQELKNKLQDCNHEQINHLFKIIDFNKNMYISEEELRDYLLKRQISGRNLTKLK